MPQVRPTVTSLEDRCTPAASLPVGFSESVVAAGLNRPSALAAAPDGRVFVAEQTGAVRVIAGGKLLADPFTSVTVDASVNGFRSHSGLIGLAVDPQFRSNGYLYVFYTAPGQNGAAPFNRVSRFTAAGNTAAGGETVLINLDPLPNPTGEQGGTMAFGLRSRPGSAKSSGTTRTVPSRPTTPRRSTGSAAPPPGRTGPSGRSACGSRTRCRSPRSRANCSSRTWATARSRR